ncbi:MAG TPA: hypothetical protein VF039_04385 [Longimicrobiales bacterium]
MPDTNERVMAMVEQELRANPDMSNEDLRARAEKLDDAIAGMSARQFNATYPLQVKRRLMPAGARRARKASKRARGRKAGAKPGGRGTGAGATRRSAGKRGAKAPAKAGKRGRAAARAVGTDIRRGRGRPAGAAVDGARGRVRAALLDFARDLASADGAGLVDVIAGVDGYVDRVMKATGTR